MKRESWATVLIYMHQSIDKPSMVHQSAIASHKVFDEFILLV